MNVSDSSEKANKSYALKLPEKVGIDEETVRRKILKWSGSEQQHVGIAMNTVYPI